MCDPVSIGTSIASAASSMVSPAAIAGGALGLGGSLLQAQGQAAALRAQRAAAAAEAARQREYEARQFAAADAARQSYDRDAFDRAEQEAVARRGAAYAQAPVLPDTMRLPAPAGGSAATDMLMDARREQNRQLLDDEGRRRALLDAWADVLFNRQMQAGRAAERGLMEGAFARRSLGLLPQETRVAGFAGQGLRSAGDLMTLGAMIAAPLTARAAPTWAGIFGK